MNDKSKTKKTAFAMSEEKFQQILQEQERSEPFDDKALEKFVLLLYYQVDLLDYFYTLSPKNKKRIFQNLFARIMLSIASLQTKTKFLSMNLQKILNFWIFN